MLDDMYDETEDRNEPSNGGSLRQRYEIYRAAAEDLGWKVLSFEEWLNR